MRRTPMAALGFDFRSDPRRTLINQTVSTVIVDGLTRTVTTDYPGDSINDLTETDATVFDADGSRTEPSPI